MPEKENAREQIPVPENQNTPERKPARVSPAADRKAAFSEVFRFALSGGVCFIIEFVSLVLLRDGLHLPTLIATPIAFLISVVFNYLLCVKWVFHGVNGSGNAARVGFLLTSVAGLLLNELMMWLLGLCFDESRVLFTVLGFSVSAYMVNKVIATVVVMIWNYFLKKAVLKAAK